MAAWQKRSSFPRLNAIVDVDVAERAGWSAVRLSKAYLNAGVRFLQLRAKLIDSRQFLDLVEAVVDIGRPYGATIIVNDRADIARLADASGVHVGQHDLSPTQVRPLVGEDRVVGLSTHNLEQLQRAFTEPVSYVAIGPVFATSSKAAPDPVIGLDIVKEASTRVIPMGLPLVAIGGITLETAGAVIESGASSVAVISDLLRTGDPESRARAYLATLEEGA
ncbi:MAG TPA: thiamine phosphate synthase [Vicinamibacterales bacterium]|nr:thiamine phosphate synthase [Vicinamibacterales bacterium]